MASIRSLWCAGRRRVAASRSLLPAATLAALRLRRWRFGGADGNLAAIREADETRGYDTLVCLKPPSHNSLRFILFLHRDRTNCHRVVVLDDIDKGAVRATLDSTGRDHNHLLERVNEQADIDELTGPELQIGIGELGFELYGAGGLINLDLEHFR